MQNVYKCQHTWKDDEVQKSKVSVNAMYKSNASEKLVTWLMQNCERCVTVSITLYAESKENAKRFFWKKIMIIS